MLFLPAFGGTLLGQGKKLFWTADGQSWLTAEPAGITKHTIGEADTPSVIVRSEKLKPAGNAQPIGIASFSVNGDWTKFLIFTNTRKVWRLNTRGDYWVYDTRNNAFFQLGKGLPAASLMFAKFSPDGSQVAYVSGNNLYVENLSTRRIKALTKDGTRRLINGTFDWAYEEEFFCRDGFRWSPDSRKIAYWQVDANGTRDFYMINNTDSVYSRIIPVEYPKAGEPPSAVKVGVVDIATAKTQWMKVPGDARQNYLPRMEWAANSTELVLQQLNRRQNESRILLADAVLGNTKTIYTEIEKTWVDIQALWDADYATGWDWIRGGREFIWPTEKDGWRHLYRVSRDGKTETLITKGNFDVIDIVRVDEAGGFIYYLASPDNATQKYLYRSAISGNLAPERLTPPDQPGTHSYDISPGAKAARHVYSSISLPPVSEMIVLPGHTVPMGKKGVKEAMAGAGKGDSGVEFFKITTDEGVEMDGWMVKPLNFDPAKKYPVVFYVYTEPWGQNVVDSYGAAYNFLYQGDMREDGYVYISIDNRGTPCPKGREWRKSIYRKIGLLNISDQAAAAKKVLAWPFIDSSRVAVWGWSGGGTATLNLMFQYPEIYKTGIAIAAVANQLTYDNIYQERYMGLPSENRDDFIKGSPLSYARNLRGNLLYIHGTGDDNVHYANAEMLINELVKYNKPFQLMIYPNRTHSISEGEGTGEHLAATYTRYLKMYCPPGGR